MIIAFIGGVIIVMTANVDGIGVAGYVVGGIFVLLGLLAMDWHKEDVKARTNRRRYLAYGEKPDWARNNGERTDYRKFCPDCGKPVGRSDRFCSNCGRALS